jgi:hypothetical protein
MREDRREYWAKVVAEHEASGQPVKVFCGERGLSLYNFYCWRRRLRETEPAPQLALVNTKARVRASESCGSEPALELIFATGERLHIRNGADAATLRLTVDAVRA